MAYNKDFVTENGKSKCEACQPLVLVAEDDPLTMRLTCDILQGRGYLTMEITNGRMVLEAAHQNSPDLIILDIQLPGMTGIEIAKKLRQDEKLKQTPLLAVTGLSQPSEKAQIMEAGCDEYLAKPVSVKQLTAKVDEMLARTKKYAIAKD